MEIRLARDEELSLIREIEKASGELFRTVGLGELADAELPPIEHYRRFLTHGAIYVLEDVEDTGRLAGFILLAPYENAAHIYELSVHPDFQRRGLGAQLLHQASHWAVENDYLDVTLTTFQTVPWNAPFYAKHGYEIVQVENYTPAQHILWENEELHGLSDRCFMQLTLIAADEEEGENAPAPVPA